MKGYSVVMSGEGSFQEQGPRFERSYKEYDRPITLEELQAAVGGSIELIPEFECIRWNNEEVEGVAFCNEEGRIKGMRINSFANFLYEGAMQRKHDNINLRIDPQWLLVGPVIFVWGDQEFMDQL